MSTSKTVTHATAPQDWIIEATAARKLKRLSMDALAEMTRTSAPTISRMFKGKRVNVTVLRDVASVLGCSDPPGIEPSSEPTVSEHTTDDSPGTVAEWMQIGQLMQSTDPDVFKAFTAYLRIYRSLRHARQSVEGVIDRMARNLMPSR